MSAGLSNLSGSVGRGGRNSPADVRLVQQLLNRHRPTPMAPLDVDGVAGPKTVEAICEFQRRVVKMAAPDGRVDPGGRTFTLLAGPPAPAAAAGASNLSGASWWHANQAKYPNSTSVDDLEPGFRAKVKEFLAALDAAGADVAISATRRNKHRAYLMHDAWRLAHGQIKASEIPADPAVNIVWDHGDAAKSRRAAQQMVQLFGMAHPAVLDSLHIEGKAIDMTIAWTGTLAIKKGFR
jgi:peptidoglycan hydrolase-like protein with peptidoglycan-binding domain